MYKTYSNSLEQLKYNYILLQTIKFIDILCNTETKRIWEFNDVFINVIIYFITSEEYVTYASINI